MVTVDFYSKQQTDTLLSSKADTSALPTSSQLVPSTTGASSGDVLTFDGSAVSWSAGGSGGGGITLIGTYGSSGSETTAKKKACYDAINGLEDGHLYLIENLADGSSYLDTFIISKVSYLNRVVSPGVVVKTYPIFGGCYYYNNMTTTNTYLYGTCYTHSSNEVAICWKGLITPTSFSGLSASNLYYIKIYKII